MILFSQAFVRMPDGSWFCRAPAEVTTPTGRIQVTPGTSYVRGRLHMGVDVAAALDDYTVTGYPPPGWG